MKGKPNPRWADQVDENMARLHARIAAMEDRQRTAKVHDPTCPVAVTQQAQRQTDMHLTVPDCRCWLSRPREWPDMQVYR